MPFRALALVLLAALCIACAPGFISQPELLSNVRADPVQISPNGDGVADRTTILYELSQDATVTITLEDGSGRRFPFRQEEKRPAGAYAADFDGTYVPTAEPNVRRVLPDGRYRFVIDAIAAGRSQTRQGEVLIKDGDATPLSVSNLIANPSAISPNSDGQDDDAVIGWDLSKPAEVTIFALDDQGQRTLILAPSKREAGPDSLTWNGRSTDQILADGLYQIVVQASDPAGNQADSRIAFRISGGGKARLDITKVVFTPTAMAVGGTLSVSITVKNTGEVPILSNCPKWGAAYTTNESYTKFTVDEEGARRPECFERSGAWRVGVGWDQAPIQYPARWGLTEDLGPLKPGDERTITGKIQILITRVSEVKFWAGVEQGGVGFPGGQRGITAIRISF